MRTATPRRLVVDELAVAHRGGHAAHVERAVETVADGEALQHPAVRGGVGRLDDDASHALRIDDGRVRPEQAAERDVASADVEALVIGARPHGDDVTRHGGVDRRLDARVLRGHDKFRRVDERNHHQRDKRGHRANQAVHLSSSCAGGGSTPPDTGSCAKRRS